MDDTGESLGDIIQSHIDNDIILRAKELKLDVHGRIHCTTGPAGVMPNKLVWYIHGHQYDTFNDWCIALKKTEKQRTKIIEECTLLKLQYGGTF